MWAYDQRHCRRRSFLLHRHYGASHHSASERSKSSKLPGPTRIFGGDLFDANPCTLAPFTNQVPGAVRMALVVYSPLWPQAVWYGPTAQPPSHDGHTATNPSKDKLAKPTRKLNNDDWNGPSCPQARPHQLLQFPAFGVHARRTPMRARHASTRRDQYLAVPRPVARC